MAKVIFFVLVSAVVIFSTQLSIASEKYRPSTEGSAASENMARAQMCVQGMYVTLFFFGDEAYQTDKLATVVDAVKSTCVDDALVLSMYNAMKNSPNEVSMEVTKAAAEELVSGAF